MEKEVKTMKFKTTINCGGCVASVTPFLNKAEGIKHWEVDTTVKEKILTVNAEDITEQQVMEIVKKAGFKIETLN